MIKTLITDVDGVFTDGGFYYTTEGKVMKKFGPHDGDGVKMIKEMGIRIIAISADRRGYGITKTRMEDMDIECYLVSEAERFEFVKQFDPETIAFVGDGIHDAACMKLACRSYAPFDATNEAASAATVWLQTSGGCGVLLEVALDLKGHING